MYKDRRVGAVGRRLSVRFIFVLLSGALIVWMSLIFYRHHRLHHESMMEEILKLKKELAEHAEISVKEDQEAHGGLSKSLLTRVDSKLKHISSDVSEQLKSLEFSVAKLEVEKQQHDLFHKESVDKLLHSHAPESESEDQPPASPPVQAQAQAQLVLDSAPPRTTLLVIASSRFLYLKQCLGSVVQYHPRKDISVVISEDGSSHQVETVVKEAKQAFQALLPSSSSPPPLSFEHVHFPDGETRAYENGYFRLCAHFKWALDTVFRTQPNIDSVIVLEEDLLIAPDFFEYFLALAPLLSDPRERLLAVSAFNDNGLRGRVSDPARLFRSDFFPGLGWMLTRATWMELSSKWPRAYWDDWLREPKNRQGRHIIRPEFSRTFHFGSQGVSNSEFGGFLQSVQLNTQFIRFRELDLGYLSVRRWDSEYLSLVSSATLVSRKDLASLLREGDEAASALGLHGGPEGPGLRVEYADFDEFVRLAGLLGIMDNIKANVPRTAYKGVVSTWLGPGKMRVHVVPTLSFSEILASKG